MLLDKIVEMNRESKSATLANSNSSSNNNNNANHKRKCHKEADHVQVMVLSAEDYAELSSLDVSMRNASRELLHGGKAAITRAIRGAREVFTAYQLTLYGKRVLVRHFLSSAVIAIHKVNLSSEELSVRKSTLDTDHKLLAHEQTSQATNNFFCNRNNANSKDVLYVVTLHGVMSLQTPSMLRDLFVAEERSSSCSPCISSSALHNNPEHRNGNLKQMSVLCYYDRVLTFTPRKLPLVNRAWERRKSPFMVLCNDQLHLRPMPHSINNNTNNNSNNITTSETAASCLYCPFTSERVIRLLIEFGLESCEKDGVELIKCVMERATSDASEHLALDVLVFGVTHLQLSTIQNNNNNNNNNINNSRDEEYNENEKHDELTVKCYRALHELLRNYVTHYSDKTHVLEKK